MAMLLSVRLRSEINLWVFDIFDNLFSSHWLYNFKFDFFLLLNCLRMFLLQMLHNFLSNFFLNLIFNRSIVHIQILFWKQWECTFIHKLRDIRHWIVKEWVNQLVKMKMLVPCSVWFDDTFHELRGEHLSWGSAYWFWRVWGRFIWGWRVTVLLFQ